AAEQVAEHHDEQPDPDEEHDEHEQVDEDLTRTEVVCEHHGFSSARFVTAPRKRPPPGRCSVRTSKRTPPSASRAMTCRAVPTKALAPPPRAARGSGTGTSSDRGPWSRAVRGSLRAGRRPADP